MIKYYLEEKKELLTEVTKDENGNEIEKEVEHVYWDLCQKEFVAPTKEEKEEVAKDAEEKAINEGIEDEKKIKDLVGKALVKLNKPYKDSLKKFNDNMKKSNFVLLPTSLNAIVRKVIGKEESYKLLDDEYTKLKSLISADVSYRNAKLQFSKAVKESIKDKELLSKGFSLQQILELKKTYKSGKKAVNVLKLKEAKNELKEKAIEKAKKELKEAAKDFNFEEEEVAKEA